MTTILFVCRGNALRSIMAESYVNSLQLPGITATSGGTIASANKHLNTLAHSIALEILANHDINPKHDFANDVTQLMLNAASIVICMNQIIADEAVSSGLLLPPKAIVWDIKDIGEGNRSEDRRNYYSEIMYGEIVDRVDDLLARITQH